MAEIKILVVEDEAITAMDIKKTLEKFGYKIPAIGSSGEEAVALSKKLNPDLVLMDVVLKGKMDGAIAAQEISNNLHIPIVFLTAYGDFKTFNLAKLSIPYGYLTKPFEAIELRIAVDLALFKHQMEKESAAETNRLKNEFLANMSHELRTPLNGIIGFTELIYKEKLGEINAEHKKYLGDVLSNSFHLLRLIEGVLDLTKIESGTMEFHPELININKLIDEVGSTFSNEITEKGIQLNIQVDPKLTDIVIDPEALKQVIYNYVSNAIKFSLAGGKIEIYARPDGDEDFCIEVKDYGIGISQENMNKLFIPFQQLDLSKAKKYQGTGLGLALILRIVKAQGGKAGAHSKYGKESTFFVILPRRP